MTETVGRRRSQHTNQPATIDDAADWLRNTASRNGGKNEPGDCGNGYRKSDQIKHAIGGGFGLGGPVGSCMPGLPPIAESTPVVFILFRQLAGVLVLGQALFSKAGESEGGSRGPPALRGCIGIIGPPHQIGSYQWSNHAGVQRRGPH